MSSASGPGPAKIIHLQNLCWKIGPSPVQAFYYDLLGVTAGKTDTSLPPQFHQQFCQSCGRLLVPGLSSRTRIRYKKRKPKRISAEKLETDGKTPAWEPRRRQLTTLCLSCNHSEAADVLTPSRKRTVSRSEPGKKAEGTVKNESAFSTSQQGPEKPKKKTETKQNSAKARAKKRKQNSLSALLSKERETSTRPSMSLFDFQKDF